MNRLITILLCATAAVTAAFAQDSNRFKCTMGDLTRRVEIMHETGVSVPCEVQYYKDTESPGEAQVLWRALNEEGYCEAKATEFVSNLAAMGWDCGANVDAPVAEPSEAAPEAELIDDSDVLAPAEPVGESED